MTANGGDPDVDDSGADDPLLVEWAAELALRMREGKTLDWRELARRHPERAAALQDMLPAFDLVAGLGGASDAEPTRAYGASEPLPGLGQLGDFRLLREVGRGGMGVVYEAVQPSLGRRVALKVLPPTATMDARHVQRFQVEATAAALLQHDRIVPVYAVGCEHGVPFYAMQFIEGRSLAQYIRALAEGGSSTTESLPSGAALCGADRTGRARDGFAAVELPASEPDRHAEDPATVPLASDSEVRRGDHIRVVASLGLQAAEALAYAHAQGVIHRDIKPGNLRLDVHGSLWITDFGLARVQTDPTLTATGTVLGTLRYMSPEQAVGDTSVVDYRTDVYSLGTTLYELLTLRPAVTGRDARTILRRLAEEGPSPIRTLNPAAPPDLQAIVMKALARDAAARYASAAALAEDLRRFLAGEPILASPPSAAARLRRWARRRKALAVSAVVGALALAAGFGFAAWYGAPDRHLVARLTTEHQDIARKNEQLGRRNRYLARSSFATHLHKASLMLQSHQVSQCR